jgi:hypothetical protein
MDIPYFTAITTLLICTATLYLKHTAQPAPYSSKYTRAFYNEKDGSHGTL